MIQIEEAKEIALKYINEINTNISLSIMEEETISFEYGWMFFYQSTKFIETGDEKHLVGGNAPLIVDKINQSIHVTGTRLSDSDYIEKYCRYRGNINEFYIQIG